MIRAAAPASTANLGPGFDAAGAALDLWNEVELEEGAFAVEVAGEGAGELPHDERHLSLQAFSVFAPVAGYRFRFVNRIPLERGLGSSAAAIALGLVAGARAAGATPSADELLALAGRFEPHFDNLAAALHGGVCVAWQEGGEPRARRVADDVPAAAVAVVPATRTSTAASRGTLPETVSHADAATTAGAALLLGAALGSGDASLLAPALRDRLHEPYRAAGAPLLERVRELAPPGLLGVTLSGSGPTVIAWIDRASADNAAASLRAYLGAEADVLPLAGSQHGAIA
ncbi:MAG TPA: homoserine kinase [Gaiellaceae bacterium]|nr:homoserine kinase [Gaiellaceae bacterium]